MSRKSYSANLKAKAALEAVRGERMVNEIASSIDVHPNQIGKWKKQLLESVAELFADGRNRNGRKDEEKLIERLYQEIGQLKVELDWLKKKTGYIE